jgi:hypothetical protein
MTSTDQSKPPRFKNFRAIALNSFTNEWLYKSRLWHFFS